MGLKRLFGLSDGTRMACRPRLFGAICLAAALGLALAGSLPASTEPSDDGDAFVECEVNGRRVFKRRRECVGRHAVVAEVGAKGRPSNPSWASISKDQGVTLVPVLVCRTREALMSVTSTAEENRGVLARAAGQTGLCARLPGNTMFALVRPTDGALQIRTTTLGEVWVSPTIRISKVASIPLPERFGAMPGVEQPPARGLSAEEQQAVREELADEDTVLGFGGYVQIGDGTGGRSSSSSDSGGMIKCRCRNGRVVHTQRKGRRACDDACDVHVSRGLTGVDEDGCRFHGRKVDCRDLVRLKWEEENGGPP